jgi:cytochrome b6-f complex iron-sulfur subunit
MNSDNMNSDTIHDTLAENTLEAESGSVTRRQVLATAVKTAGAGLLLLLPMARESANADTAHHAAPDTASWTVIGHAAQFVKGRPQRTALAGGAVLYVTRLTPATLSVVSAKCTHRGCEVGWDKGKGQFVCPCHGAAFTTSGKNLHGTTRQPDQTLPALPLLPAVQKKGQVLVNLNAVPAPALVPGH